MHLYNYVCVIIDDDLRYIMGRMDQPDKGFLWVHSIINCKSRRGNETDLNSIQSFITNIAIIILGTQAQIYA